MTQSEAERAFSLARVRKFAAQSAESEAVVSLFKSAERMLSTYRMSALDADALLAVLSTGVEKMLKLTYGFIIEAMDGAWPAQKVMYGYGHDVARLDADCRALLWKRVDLAVHPNCIRTLLQDLDADPFAGQLMTVLSRYGQKGRFYNLDHLSANPQQEDAPRVMWEVYDSRVTGAEPALPVMTAISNNDFETLVRTPANERHRVILNRWRETYFRALIHGVAGAEAKKFGWEFSPNR